jgi:membrane-bound lytic murein transglycosylase MltF
LRAAGARRTAPARARAAGLRRGALVIAWIAAALTAACDGSSPWGAPKPGSGPSGLDRSIVEERWTGDLDGMIERRLIRVLVVPSKTFFFVDRGTQRGTTYEMFRAFEDDLNRKVKTGQLPVHVVFVPVRGDRLLQALAEGRGDIATAHLIVTPTRAKQVDFSRPVWTGVSEVVVTAAGAPRISAVEDLSGREVLVRASSSYHESLLSLNTRLSRAGKRPVLIKHAPEQLEDEDLLEMANAGLLDTLIVDSHKARFWAQIFPSVVVHEEVAVRTGAEIAWAFRKGSPHLKKTLDDFIRRHGQGTEFGNVTFRRYLESTEHLRNPTSGAEMAKFVRTIDHFKKYAARYGFDWLMLAAQGYQESGLDQGARSAAGAIGVMQVLPATGKAMNVGDIRQLEPNIHAGVKYMRHLIDEYLDGNDIDPLNRTLLAIASYNAGPVRIAQLRAEAKTRGLDPNVWFDNVERVAAERIGAQTVQYVSNIYKYYVAYSLALERAAERERSIASVRRG